MSKRGDGMSGMGGGGPALGSAQELKQWKIESSAIIKQLENLLQSKSGVFEGDSFNWEKYPISDFKTVLSDIVSIGDESLAEDVFYIKYKNLGWVRIDSESDPTWLRQNMSNIVGAIDDGGWGYGFYGDVSDVYAYNFTESEDHVRGYDDDFRWEFRTFRDGGEPYVGELGGDGTIHHFIPGSYAYDQYLFRDKTYDIDWKYVTRKDGSMDRYASVHLDLSDIVTKKRK